jgi:hypothetical protein
MDKLMAILVKKGYLAHPHIMMAAYNDATTHSFAPLQVGQFEGGNEIDEALSVIALEGGGGGHVTESSELLMYYLARHTDIHCWSKRGKKGYVFLAGDELPYPTVRASHVARLIGDKLQSDILTSKLYPIDGDIKSLHGAEVKAAEGDILAELQERYEVFWIMPGGTSHENNPEVTDRLQAMFGQNFLRLPNPDDVCELVASTIGLTEGYDLHDIKSDLISLGADRGSVDRATTAVAKYAGTRTLSKAATASGTLATAGGSDDVKRL